MPDDLQFYLAQLKERLQYYKEMGIGGLSVKVSREKALAAVGPGHEETLRSVSVSGSVVANRRTSLFEVPQNQQPSGESLESIRLYGVVHSEEEKETVERVVRGIKEIKNIKDDLTVFKY